MKVFLGWSGSRSYEVGKAFEEWLPKVIQAIDPFISSEIPKGKRGVAVIADELEVTKDGIICLTKENLKENWILFEAGALSKTKDANVCTFLLDLKSTDIEEPLASFQHTTFKKEDIRKLMDTINEAVKKSGERSLGETQLNSTFDKHWTELEAKLKGIIAKPPEEDEIGLKEREIGLKEEEMSQARELPKIKVLDAKIHSADIVGLRVKNVGAGGEVRVSVVNNEWIKARWFKSYREMKVICDKEKIKLARGDECYVGITRRAVIGGIRSDIGSHQIKVRFHEANQIFKYGFRITEEGMKDLEVLGEEDE